MNSFQSMENGRNGPNLPNVVKHVLEESKNEHEPAYHQQMVANHVQEKKLKLSIVLNQVHENFTDNSCAINSKKPLLNICSTSFTVLDSVDLRQDDNGLSSGSEEVGLEYDSGEGSGSLPQCDVTGI